MKMNSLSFAFIFWNLDSSMGYGGKKSKNFLPFSSRRPPGKDRIRSRALEITIARDSDFRKKMC